jgi:DNA-binding transcriptional LysR family regulator
LVPALYSHPDLVYQTIRREEFYLAVPSTHVANKLIKENNDSNYVDLSRLNGMPFISLYAKAYKEFISPLFIEAGYKPNVIFVCNNWNNSPSLVEMGLGLAIVPYWFAEKKHEKINYYHIKTKFRNYRLFSCVYNRKQPMTLEIQKFVNYVKDNYGDVYSKEPFEYSTLSSSFNTLT